MLRRQTVKDDTTINFLTWNQLFMIKPKDAENRTLVFVFKKPRKD